MRNIVTIEVATLVGLAIDGIEMQVVNPAYFQRGVANAKWREMRSVKIDKHLIVWKWHAKPTYTDKGYSAAPKDSKPKIQMYAEDYYKLIPEAEAMLQTAGEA